MKKYMRASLVVCAEQYAENKGLEDGFELYTKVVTNGWLVHDGLVQIRRNDGSIVCPFVKNRRGQTFIREGDYIIVEADGDKHVCGEDKFPVRFRPIVEK